MLAFSPCFSSSSSSLVHARSLSFKHPHLLSVRVIPHRSEQGRCLLHPRPSPGAMLPWQLTIPSLFARSWLPYACSVWFGPMVTSCALIEHALLSGRTCRERNSHKNTSLLHAWLWMSTVLRPLHLYEWISQRLAGGKSHSAQENAYKNSLCWFGNMTAGLFLSYCLDRQNNKIPKMSQRLLIKTELRVIEECVRVQNNKTQCNTAVWVCIHPNETKPRIRKQHKTKTKQLFGLI